MLSICYPALILLSFLLSFPSLCTLSVAAVPCFFLLQVSSGIATFLNMHPDEMLSRLGNCDNWLPNSELEFFGSMTCQPEREEGGGEEGGERGKRGQVDDEECDADEIVKLLDSRVVRNLRILRRCPRVRSRRDEGRA